MLELLLSKKEMKNSSFNYPYKLFFLYDDREKIYDRINKRVDDMINCGIIEETKNLFKRDNISDSLSAKAIGYKELKPYLDRVASLNDCVELLKQKTRNYAKRQFTSLNQFDNYIKIKYVSSDITAKEMFNCINNTRENKEGDNNE